MIQNNFVGIAISVSSKASKKGDQGNDIPLVSDVMSWAQNHIGVAATGAIVALVVLFLLMLIIMDF